MAIVGGMKILILSADLFEDSELLEPLDRLRAAGMQVDVGSFTVGTIHGKHGEDALANRAIACLLYTSPSPRD